MLRTLVTAYALSFALAAWAEDAPLDLHANPAPAKSAKAKKPKTAPTVNLSEADVLAQANASLEAARVMSADFVQISASGRRTEGQLTLQRPGKMLFHYQAPAHLDIIADGTSVAVRDTKLNTEDLYFIWQTPLKFLLKDHIDLARDTKVLSVQADQDSATVELEDKATLGGTSHVTLIFDPQTFALKQWTVIDPQRAQTVVSLFNVDLKSQPDPANFVIPPQPVSPNRRN